MQSHWLSQLQLVISCLSEYQQLQDNKKIVEYTPLERPVSYSAAPNVHVDDPNSDDDACDGSDSESEDSDSPCYRAKRHKMHTERTSSVDKQQKPQLKKNKYDIWCSELQESALTDDLVNIDVANKILDRSRDVESYDYSLAFKHHSDTTVDTVEESAPPSHSEPAYGNKRRFHERGNVKQRLGRRENGSKYDNEHCAPRHLLALNCSINDSEEELAKDIADKLWEHKEDLILRVVQVLGKQKAIDLFEKTRKVEEVGGLMIMNGQRRRTPGGSYLFLLKMDDNIPQEKKQKIFLDDKEPWQKQRRIRRKRKFHNLKKTLSSDKLSDVDLPTLLTRAELVASKAAEDVELEEGEAEATDKEDSTNPPPPPSPATDGRDNSSDGEDRSAQISFENRENDSNRRTVTYDDDDFLDVSCNTMDLF